MSFSICSTNTLSEAKLFELQLARLSHGLVEEIQF